MMEMDETHVDPIGNKVMMMDEAKTTNDHQAALNILGDGGRKERVMDEFYGLKDQVTVSIHDGSAGGGKALDNTRKGHEDSPLGWTRKLSRRARARGRSSQSQDGRGEGKQGQAFLWWLCLLGDDAWGSVVVIVNDGALALVRIHQE